MRKENPKSLLWTDELIEIFWDGIQKTRLAELNFALLAGSYFLELIRDELSKDKTFLDYGSGSGEIITSLVKQGFSVAAYEISEERALSLNRSLEDVKNDSFIGYVSNTDNRLFDTILLTEVIEHVIPAQLLSTIETIKAKLKPGGTLIITTPNDEDIELGCCYCPTCNHTFHRWQHLTSFTVKALEDLMLECGFHTKNIHLVDFSMNRNIFEENKRLKNKIESLQKPFLRKLIEKIKNSTSVKKGVSGKENLRLGFQSHILYIGSLLPIR